MIRFDLLLAVILVFQADAIVDDPSQYVDILSGTYSRIDYSTGSLLPFVGRPWGMNNWAVQTNNYAGARASPLTHWWFHPEDREFYGVRCTHQASPWIYDYGEFLIMPSVGPLKDKFPDKASAYNRSSAIFRPYELNATLESFCTSDESQEGCTSVALTATERAALLKIRFPREDVSSGWNQTRHVRVLVGRDGAGITDSIVADVAQRTVSGYTRANSGGVPIGLRSMDHTELSIVHGGNVWVTDHQQMNLSYSLNLQGYDIGTAHVPIGEDPATACVSACHIHNGCQAFSVELGPLADRPKCRLKSKAVHRPDATASTTLSGWTYNVIPQIEIVQFAHYFYMEVGSKFASFKKNMILDDNMYKIGLEGVLSLESSINEVDIRIGTSFISIDQAKQNLNSEIPVGTNYDELRASSRQAWNDLLGKAELQDAGNKTIDEGLFALRTWYTNIYRSSVYPRMLFEYDAGGKPIHYSPYDEHGRTFPGRLSSDSGFWDAYRSVYPLNSVFRSDQMGIQMEGWLNAYREHGAIPGWASPGARGAMTGNMQDASFADAIVKGILNGSDAQVAYTAIIEDAFDAKAKDGRKGLQFYESLGFVPVGHGISDEVAVTLNYALADFSLHLAAKHVGDTVNATRLQARSNQSWRMLWNPTHKGGFFAPKHDNGEWDPEFDEFAWGGPYTEASAWQYRFYVPHDPAGLRDAYRDAPGNQSMCDLLEETMTGRGAQRPGRVFHNGQWGLHHEQVEMVENCFGEYEHNNQPVWHQLYMFAPAGCPAKGQFWLRQALTKFYSPTLYSGDEDNGSMSAWFLLSAMGIYQLVPGSTRYSIGAPLYRKLVLHLDNGRVLKILAEGNAPDTPYVHAVYVNGLALRELYIDYWQLRAGGTISFTMGKQPCDSFPCSEPASAQMV